MTTDTPDARDAIAEALYFAMDDPAHTDRILDAYRDQVLTEAAELLKAQHAAVYDDAGGRVASGLLISADLLLAARSAGR